MKYQPVEELSDIDKLVRSQQLSVNRLIKQQQQQQQQQLQQQATMNKFLMHQQTTINSLLRNQQTQIEAITRIMQYQLPQNEQLLRLEYHTPDEEMPKRRRKTGVTLNENMNPYQNGDSDLHKTGFIQDTGFKALNFYDHHQKPRDGDAQDNLYMDQPRPTSPHKGLEFDETPQLFVDMSKNNDNMETPNYNSLNPNGKRNNGMDEGVNRNSSTATVQQQQPKQQQRQQQQQLKQQKQQAQQQQRQQQKQQAQQQQRQQQQHQQQQQLKQRQQQQAQQQQIDHQHQDSAGRRYERDIKRPLIPAKGNLTSQQVRNMQRQHTLARLIGKGKIESSMKIINNVARDLVRNMISTFSSASNIPWNQLDPRLQQYGQNALELELLKYNIPIIRCHDQWFSGQTVEQMWNLTLKTGLTKDDSEDTSNPQSSNKLSSGGTAMTTTQRQRHPSQPTKKRTTTPTIPTSNQSLSVEARKRKRTPSLPPKQRPSPPQKQRPQPKVIPEL